MEFICSKSEFIKKYTHSKNIISSKSSLPILSNVLIEVDNSKLRLFASDLETHCCCVVHADVIKQGSLAVPAKKLSDIIQSFPNDSAIHFSSLPEEHRLKIESQDKKIKIKFVLSSCSKEGYPKFPSLKEANIFSIDQSLLKKMIRKTIFAASKTGLQPNMEGICFDRVDNQLNLVASDGKRLALMSTSFENKAVDKFKIVVSTDVLRELSRVLKDSGDCKISLTDKEIQFQVDEFDFVSNLFDSDFPNYRIALESNFKHKVILDTLNLSDSIQMLSHMTDPVLGRIELKFSKNGLFLFAEHPELGEAKDELPMVDYKSEEKEVVAFNFHYMQDALREIEDEKVCLKFNDSKGPILIEGKEDNTFFSVVMPMKRRQD